MCMVNFILNGFSFDFTWGGGNVNIYIYFNNCFDEVKG